MADGPSETRSNAQQDQLALNGLCSAAKRHVEVCVVFGRGIGWVEGSEVGASSGILGGRWSSASARLGTIA
jgi:hypothetical protein